MPLIEIAGRLRTVNERAAFAQYIVQRITRST